MKRFLEKIDPYTTEEQEIIREGKKAKEELILAITRLVVSIAKKFSYFNNDIEENFQISDLLRHKQAMARERSAEGNRNGER